MVGLGKVLQQSPLAVTAEPPSSVMDPPMVEEVVVIALMTGVDILRLFATNVTSFP
jgi:hypothetical protein